MFKLFETEPRKTISQLLRYVEKGDQTQAELFVQENPKSIILRDAMIGAHRKFPRISAFELAAWNWDVKHMCYAMLYHSLCFLPISEAEEIRIILNEQSEFLDTIGIEYQANDEARVQPHYNWHELTDPFDTFISQFNQWTEEERSDPSEAYDQLWSNYALAQESAPAHILQHYNDPDVPFRDPVPDFNANQFNRKGVALEWRDEQHRRGYSEAKYQHRSLARAIIRSRQPSGGRYSSIPQLDFNGGWRQDRIAIAKLSETRQHDWLEIKKLLKKPIIEVVQILRVKFQDHLEITGYGKAAAIDSFATR